MIAIGLDLSATSTGLVVLKSRKLWSPPTPPEVLREEIIAVKTKGMQRCSDQAERVIDAVNTFKPERVVIEGYGGQFKNSLIPQVEVGTVVRYFLKQLGYSWLEVAPLAVKKFALGKGSGDKSQIMLQVFKRWGHTSMNDDTADAYVLGCIGLGHAGEMIGLTQPMHEVIDAIKLNN